VILIGILRHNGGIWFSDFGHGELGNPQRFPRDRDLTRIFLDVWVEKYNFRQLTWTGDNLASRDINK